MKGGFSEKRIDVSSVDFGTFEPDSKVLIRIINSFQNGRAKKTQIQLYSKLRWDLFTKYWEWLNYQDFIKIIADSSKNEYSLTPRGNEVFNLFRKYYEFIHHVESNPPSLVI